MVSDLEGLSQDELQELQTFIGIANNLAKFNKTS